MIFITNTGKEITVPSDYTFASLEKFAKELYQQGVIDTVDELRPFIHTNILEEQFIFVESYSIDKLSFAEQIKE